MHPTSEHLYKANTNRITKKKKRERKKINSNTIIVEDFNIPLSTVDKSSRQRISKETADLNDTVDQMDLTHIYTIKEENNMIN